MKIVLLGATGDTGKPLLRQCLDRGHQVTAIVRNVNKIQQKHENLTKVEADVFNPEDLSKIFTGLD